MLNKKNYNSIIKQLLGFLLLILLSSCLKKSEEKEIRVFPFKLHDYTSSDFLNRWNKETILEIEKDLIDDNPFIQLMIERYQSDTINSFGARNKLLTNFKTNLVISPNYNFKEIYIIELSFSGESYTATDFVLIEGEKFDYFFQFEGIGNWRLSDNRKGDFPSLDKLFIDWNKKEIRNNQEAQNVGPAIITKVNPDTIISKVVINPTNEQMDRINDFVKTLKKAK